jgi:hypothetical protein
MLEMKCVICSGWVFSVFINIDGELDSPNCLLLLHAQMEWFPALGSDDVGSVGEC